MSVSIAKTLHEVAATIRKGTAVPACPVPYDDAATVATASAAYTKEQAVTEEPALVVLRNDYEMAFGFPTTPDARGKAHFREGGAKWIQFPNKAFTQHDLQALVAAATAAGVSPATLGALWIVEGKAAGDQFTTGGQVLRFPTQAPIAAASAADITSTGIGVLLWSCFGADAYIPHGSKGTDNLPNPPGSSYTTQFKNLLKSLGDAGAPGPLSTAAGQAALITYLQASVSTTAWSGGSEGDGGTQVKSIPAGTAAYISIRVSRECLATLLYIDACLFHYQFRVDAQNLLAAAHAGDQIDLTDSPWVTYVRWNASEKPFKALFSAGASSQQAVVRVFGDPPLKMTPTELLQYYPDKTQSNRNGTARSPHGTAIHYKYVHQAISRWFS